MKKRVIVVRDDEPVRVAAQLMRQGGVGFLPVVDAHRHAVGVVTDRDLALRVAASNARASTLSVGEVMTPEVVACHASDELKVACELMQRHRVARLVVLAGDGSVQGVSSLSDLANWLENAETGVVVRHIAEREYHRPPA